MNQEKLLEELKKMVSEHLKDEKVSELFDEMSKKIKEASEVIKGLTDKVADLEVKKAELVTSLEDLESAAEEKDASIVELTAKVEDVEKTLADLGVEKEAIAAELGEMKAEELSRKRLEELKESDLLFEGDYGEKQKLLVKTMSDDEFAEYVKDQKQLKELYAKKASANGDVGADDGADSPSDVDATDAADTPAADIAAARASASAVVPNVASDQNDDTVARYKELGEFFAQKVQKRYERYGKSKGNQ